MIITELVEPVEFVIDSEGNKRAVRQWATVIAPKDAPVLTAAVSARPQRLVTLDVGDFLTTRMW